MTQVLYWPQIAKIGFIECNSRKKKVWISQWQDLNLNATNYEQNDKNGLYKQGIAIRLGQCLEPCENRYSFALDFDGWNAVTAWFSGANDEETWNNVLEMAKKTRIEWHQDKSKLHMIMYSNRPITNKKIFMENAQLEVRCEGNLLFAYPSIHKEGKQYTPLGTNEITILTERELLAMEAKIDTLAVGEGYMSDSNKSDYITWLEDHNNWKSIGVGEGRHNALVTLGTSYYYRYENGWRDLTDDQSKEKLWERNQMFQVPKSEKEFNAIWKWIVDKHKDRRDKELEELRRNKEAIESKIGRNLEDELTTKYHFKSMKNKTLYYYDEKEGIYVKDGEWLIEQECVKYDPEVTTKQVTDVKNRIIYSNYTDTSGDPWQFDNDIEWIAAANCLINLKTLETKEFGPENLITRKIPHRYENDQSFIIDFWEWVGDYSYRYYYYSCPKIMRFLNQVMAPEDVETVLDFMAYCLWRGFPFHKYLLLCGSGRNGKGVTMDLIKRLLGRQNISYESLQRILETRYAVAQLYGKLANIDADLSNEALENTGILKKLTGNDDLPAEFKFKTPFGFANFAKLIFSCNQMPETPDETDAFFARLIIINFPNQFLGDNADPYLIDKLTTEEEMTGLFSILVNRLPKVLTRGIYVPLLSNSIAENYEKYIQSSNPIRVFVETMIDKDTDVAMNSSVLKDDLYKAYQRYCNDRQLSVEGNQTFSRKLKKDYGFTDQQLRVDGKREWFWISIGLKEYVKVDDEQETF